MNKKKDNILSKLFYSFIRFIGLPGLRLIAELLGSLCYYLIPVRKKTIILNLSTAFPDKSLSEIKVLAKRNYKNIFTTFLEMLYFPVSRREIVQHLMRVTDADRNLAIEKYNEGKGLIFLSAHFGSWEVAALSGALTFKKPFKVLAQKQSSDFFNHFLLKAREVHGNKTIWLGKSVRHIYEALKNGEIVGIVGDQRGPKESLRVNYFGKQTALHPGTAYFILKTRCNVIVGLAIRQPDSNYKAFFENLDLSNLPENDPEAIREINQRYMSILEKYVRQYPDQYFWMHKIWKY